MSHGISTRRRRLGLALGVLLALASCAEERAPINRVGANALAKSFFVGELADGADAPVFYWQNFVVDASEAQTQVGIGNGSAVDRVRWDLTEDMLFARKAYSPTGGDNRGEGDLPDGTIVAAYKILEHFDIRRSYNAQTGEELNIVEENSTDQHWHQREHFRVDWSQNLVNSPLWTRIFLGTVFGDIVVTPQVAHWVSEADHPDAPVFDADDGYFDITSRFTVEPVAYQFGSFSLPACYLHGIFTGAAVADCSAQEAVVRSSYWRVDRLDPNADFEPLVTTSAPEDILGNPGGIGFAGISGILTPPTIEYDPQYGYTDANLKRLLHIHNIWEQSHQTLGQCSSDADCGSLTGRGGSQCLASGTCSIPCNVDARRDNDANGTDDQCENGDTGYDGSSGAQCSERNRCTMPYRDRQTQSILFWVNSDMPDALLDRRAEDGELLEAGATEDLVKTWSQALALSVARAREVECRRTGATQQECHWQYFSGDVRLGDEIDMVSFGAWGIPKVKDESALLELCHNPVRPGDNSRCGETGYRARRGDIRRNMLIYWPFASRAPWGGIGNWSADPLTGQIVGATATIMGAVATRSAALTRDLIMVSNGDLSLEDITRGTTAIAFENDLQLGHPSSALSQSDIDRRLEGIDISQLSAQLRALTPGDTPEGRLSSYLQLKSQLHGGPGATSSSLLDFDAIAEPLRGSVFEAQLVDNAWLTGAAGMAPTTLVDADTLAIASPLRGRDMGSVQNLSQGIESALSDRGVCLFDAATAVSSAQVLGVARYFRERYQDLSVTERAEAIYEHVWRETYKGIELHEIGHALGLLHNFASSWDSPNYNPQYWQLRTHEGRSTASCKGVPQTDGDLCLGPRYLDPLTLDERGLSDEPRPELSYFAHTSSMEYQYSRFSETVGLGQYDVMAISALYGRVLETLPVASDEADSFEPINRTQLAEEWYLNITTDFGRGIQSVHYTELARRLELFNSRRCRTATDNEIAHAEWRIVHGKICAPPPRDYAAWADFVNGQGRDSRVRADASYAADKVRWPYRYGVSFDAYPHTNPGDSGADIYEVAQSAIEKFRFRYPLDYFRRGRRDWLSFNLPSRYARRFYERLRAYHWTIAYGHASLTNIYPDSIDTRRESDDWLRPYLLAESEIFQALAGQLLAPPIGSYASIGPISSGSSLQLFDVETFQSEAFVLDASGARNLQPIYDSSPSGGGSWDYGSYMVSAGFSVEKVDAARALTDGRPVFFTLARSTILDDRNVNLNFRSDMPDAVDRLIGGVLSEDWETVAPHLTPGDLEIPQLLSLHADSPSRPDDALLLFPNVGYTQQVGVLIWAHLFGRMNGDLTLANKMRIWIDGTASAVSIAPESQLRFHDPESGYTYIARRYGLDQIAGKSVENGIASRMLEHAQDLQAIVYQLALDVDGEVVTDSFGTPELELGADSKPMVIGTSEAQDELRKYIGLLDASVQIAELVGHGPFNAR